MEQEIQEALGDWAKIIKPYKKASNKKAIIQILNSFLPFIGIWVLMYFSLSWSYWLTLGLAIVNSFFLVRIFIIQHDCGHQSFFALRKWNNRVGFACSLFTSIPYKYWAKAHSYHHGHTGQLEHRNVGDINFLTVDEFRNLTDVRKVGYRIFRMPIILFLIAPFIYLVFSNRYPFFAFKGWKSAHRAQYINNIALAFLYFSLIYFLGWKAFVFVHLPIVFSFGSIAFWFFYVQHQHEMTYMQWKDKWNYLLAAIKGATFYNLPRLGHWLTGNIGYHHIHHLSSQIPNYNLRQCADENPILQKYVTKLSFIDSLKTINSKLWDERQQRMISFSEYYEMERKRA